MKIKSINICSFGGIKNLELNLNNGFNVIYGDNENGKTTVMAFIKMMFYGTERGSNQISKNMRKKYTPWDNSAMAGSIDFETQNRNYRLERQFGTSNSTDKATLIDLDLGTRESVSSDIGVKLLGLTAAAFERSVFIGQFGFPESNPLAEGELNSKLSNITLTGDESISYTVVNERLSNAKYALMSKSGRAGEYDKNLKLLSEIEANLQTTKESLAKINSEKEKANSIIVEIENLQNKAALLKQQIDTEQDFRNAEKLKELLALKEKLDNLNATLQLENGQLVDEMFVRKVEFCLNKIDNILQKITAKTTERDILENNLNLATNPSSDATPQKAEELKQKIKTLEQEKEEIDKKISENQNLRETFSKKAKASIFTILLCFGFLLILGSIYLFNLHLLLGIIPLICGTIFVITSNVLRLVNKSKAKETETMALDLKLKETQLLSIIATEKANLTAITTALNATASIIEGQKEKLSQTTQELFDLEAEKSAENEVLFSLFARFKPTTDIEEIKSELSKISEKASLQKELKQNINYILKDVGNISYQQAEEKLKNIKTSDTVIDFAKLKEDYQSLADKITQLKTELASIMTEVKTLSANLQNPELLNQKADQLKNKIASQKEYCSALDIALSVLADSFVEVRRSYGSALEKKAGDIFKNLTGGKYQSMSISKSFDIAVEKADIFGSKEIDYLSSGTADQAYLSLRLALSHLMARENDSLPILLDDALAQYDDSRQQTALEFFKKYSENEQIILFTCHNSVANFAESIGAVKLKLKQ